MNAISWKQKVREKWLKDGDKYSKYFHLLANHRRKVNYVEELIMDNNNFKGNKALREGAKRFFQNLYNEKFNLRPKLDDLVFNSLNDTQKVQLE